MAITPFCDFCKQELEEFGGILLSPPNEEGMVKKDHLCKSCYENMIECYFTMLDHRSSNCYD